MEHKFWGNDGKDNPSSCCHFSCERRTYLSVSIIHIRETARLWIFSFHPYSWYFKWDVTNGDGRCEQHEEEAKERREGNKSSGKKTSIFSLSVFLLLVVHLLLFREKIEKHREVVKNRMKQKDQMKVKGNTSLILRCLSSCFFLIFFFCLLLLQQHFLTYPSSPGNSFFCIASSSCDSMGHLSSFLSKASAVELSLT